MLEIHKTPLMLYVVNREVPPGFSRYEIDAITSPQTGYTYPWFSYLSHGRVCWDGSCVTLECDEGTSTTGLLEFKPMGEEDQSGHAVLALSAIRANEYIKNNYWVQKLYKAAWLRTNVSLSCMELTVICVRLVEETLDPNGDPESYFDMILLGLT